MKEDVCHYNRRLVNQNDEAVNISTIYSHFLPRVGDTLITEHGVATVNKVTFDEMRDLTVEVTVGAKLNN